MFRFLSSLLLLLLITGPGLLAQMEVIDATTAPYTPENLIQNVFLGSGVVVESVTYEGDPQAVGLFDNATANIGFERGIVMSTGRVKGDNNAVGVDEPSANFASSTMDGNATSPNLQALSGKVIQDVARYTIQFRPVNDTLQFRFSFGSEEYTSYVCTDFNDAFGFFISGPGITGPFALGSENIAVIPGTDLPITINTINDGVSDSGSTTDCELGYSALYIDNENSDAPVFSGFTRTLTAEAIVTPCELYTITLEIGDGTDDILDSGVFLEAKSFGTGSLEVTTATASLDGSIAEGCEPGGIIFSVPNAPLTDLVIPFELIGSATNGVDYTQLASEITLPAGQNSVQLPIDAFEDGIAEGTEDIGFIIQLDPCTVDTVYVFVRENIITPIDIAPDATICRGDTVPADLIDATLNVPLPPPPSFTQINDLAFPQSGVAYFSPVQVFGVLPTVLGPDVIQSVCFDITHPWLDDVDVFLQAPGGLFIELTTDNGANGDNYVGTCFTPTATTVIFPGVIEPNSSAPYTGDWLPEGDWTDLYDGGPTNGTWNLIVVDDSDGFDTGLLTEWTITFNPVYDINYSWTPTAGLGAPDQANPLASPDVSTTYYVTATDSYGCTVSDSIVVNVLDVLAAPVVTCGPITDDCITWEWVAVPGEQNGYEVNVDGTGWVSPSGTLSHTVCGLVFNDTLTLEVRALDDCAGESGTQTCWTPPCDQPSITSLLTTGTTCFGDADGAVDVAAVSAAGAVTYELIDADGNLLSNTTGQFAGLAPGLYTLRLGTNMNCFLNEPIEVPETGELIVAAIVLNDISCAGADNGRALGLIQGGSWPFSFAWSSGSTDSIAVDLPAGINSVTVTDANGCTSTDDVLIDESELLTLSTRVAKTACAGTTDGIGVASATGGLGDYSYLWDANAGFQTQDTAFNLAAGQYQVTVTDDAGCETINQLTMTEGAPLELTTIVAAEAPCDGSPGGVGQVQATGGSGAPYTFEWTGVPFNPNSQTVPGLTIGTYIVEVTDNELCSDTAHLVMTADSPIEIASEVTPTDCAYNDNGTANLTVTGGGPNYTFTWSDGGPATEDRTDLPAGSYSVTVSDQTGCAQVAAVDVSAPDTLIAQIDPSTLQNVSCLAGDDGQAEAVGTGGTGALSYLWDMAADNQNTALATGLGAGDYTVTVTDANNCEATATASIASGLSIAIDFVATPASCATGSDGSVAATVTGASGTITYDWSLVGAPDAATLSNVPAGTYTLTVTDGGGCTATDSVQVSAPPALTTTISAGTNACDGPSDGTATVTPTGGTPGYTYLWSDALQQQTATASGLDNAIYFVTVTDQNGCTAVDTIDVAAPPVLTVQVSVVDVLCFGESTGELIVTAAGGTPPYSYTYADPTFPDVATVDGLPVGNYGIITVTDANGCTADTPDNAAIISGPGGSLFVTLNTQDVSCSGAADGQVSLAIGGGTGPYTYDWNGLPGVTDSLATGLAPDQYLTTVTDANGCTLLVQSEVDEPDSISISLTANSFTCNITAVDIAATVDGGSGVLVFDWSGPGAFGATTQNVFGATQAGVYTLTVTDGNACTASATYTVDPAPPALALSFVNTDTVCFNAETGSTETVVSNGVEPYFVQWADGQTTLDPVNLAAGFHTVTVIDQVGCTAVDSVFVPERPEIIITLAQEAANCNDAADGSVTVTDISVGGVSTALGNFDYQWSDQTTTGTTVTLAQGGLGYGVTVTDALGCTAKADIEVGNPAPVEAFVETRSDVSCNGGADGSVKVVGTGGTGPYTYAWPATVLSATGGVANALPAGTYTVTVADVRGCETPFDVTLAEPAPIELAFDNVAVACSGESTGYLAVEAGGGTGPYTYLWSTGSTETALSDIPAADYGLTVTDANGCELAVIEPVSEPGEPLDAVYELTDVSCFGGMDGRIDIIASGGTQPYRYALNDSELSGGSQLIALSAGMYRAHIVDARGCALTSDSLKVNEPDEIRLDLGPDVTIEFENQVTIVPEISNAFEPITYTWANQYGDFLDCDTCAVVTTDSLINSNSFSLFITDGNGCTAEDFIKVNVVKERVVLVPTGFTPNGDLANDLLLVHGKDGTTVDQFTVFDRWGEQVFSAGLFPVNSPLIGWDGQFRGKPAPAGVYIYQLEVTYKDGQRGFFRGETTLLR